MNLLDAFRSWQVSVEVVDVETTPNPDGVWVEQETAVQEVSGLLFNRATAEKYFGNLYAEDTTAILVVKQPVAIDSKVRYDGATYQVNACDDIAMQAELYQVELKR